MQPKTLIVALVCAVLFFGLASYLVPSALPTVAPVVATTRTISLAASYQAYPYWNNSNPAPTITVTQGDTVNIMLSSDGSQHQLLVDFDGDGPSTNGCTTADKCSSLFVSSTSISFVANVAGTFYYYCTLHPTFMVGMFVVQSPPGPDFGLTSNPSSVAILLGSNANSTITVSSINNFAGTITFSANSSPAGPTTSFGANPVMVSSGGTANSRLTISIPQTISLGLYSITVTGTNSSGSPSHTTAISVTVTKPDFSITSSPTSLTVAPNSSGTTSITVTSTNGFSGTLTLSATVSPSGPQLSLNPSSVTLISGGSASSNLTVSTASSGLYSTSVAQGNYLVNVTASSGSVSHLTSVSLTVGSTTSAPAGNSSLPVLPVIGGIIGALVVVGVAVFLIKRKK